MYAQTGERALARPVTAAASARQIPRPDTTPSGRPREQSVVAVALRAGVPAAYIRS
jgi:hypothetical protein